MDTATETSTESRLYTTGAIKGKDVLSTSGEHLGEIEEVVLDSSRGCIAYTVLSMRAGLFGAREKRFAVPWQALKVDMAHHDFVLDIDREMLRNSPGFDRDDWPSEPDPMFARSVNEYYGYEYPPTMSSQQGSSQQGYGQPQGYSGQRSDSGSDESGYPEQPSGYSERGTGSDRDRFGDER